MIDNQPDIGASLRKTRESLGFSLSEWAEMVMFSKPYLGHIEQGKRPAPDKVIEAYERVARSVLMKRRTLITALRTVPVVAGMANVRDPELAERLLQYGLWLGNKGELEEADRMYSVATLLADWTGDDATRAYVRARSATRGIYEGWHRSKAMATINEALSISRRNRVVLEAHAALVQIHTLAGDYSSAHAAGEAMLRASETDDDHVRTAAFLNYLECMIGAPRTASRIYDRYHNELKHDQVLFREALVYQGKALVRAGDRVGLAVALDAVKRLGNDVRMVGMAVSHLLESVDFGTPEVEELRTYAKV